MKSPLVYTGAVSLGLHLAIITALLSLGVAPEHKESLPVVSYVDLRQLWFPEKQQKETNTSPPQQSQLPPQEKSLETKAEPSPPTQPESPSQKQPVPAPTKPPSPPPAKPEPEQAVPKTLILACNTDIAPAIAAEAPAQQRPSLPPAPSSENSRSEELLGEKGDETISGSTAYAVGPVLLEATPITAENSPPIYPRTARRRGWEGEVLLLVQVNKTGQVLNAQISRSSGHNILDQAALKAVRDWHFHAARLNDQPVKTEVIVPVRSEIQD